MIATTRGALLRGTTVTDALGDEYQDDSIPEPTYSEWTPERINYLLNPSMSSAGGIGWNPGAAGGTAFVGATVGDSGQPARRQTITSISGSVSALSLALYGSRNQAAAGMPIGVTGDVWCLGIRAKASEPMTVGMFYGYGTASLTAGFQNFNVTTVEQDFFFAFPVLAAANGSVLNMRLGLTGSINPGLAVNDWIEFSNPLFTKPWDTPRFFSGADGDGALDRTRWAGAVEASGSILETRTILEAGGREGFPLSLILRNERTFDQSTGEWRTIEYYAGRVPSYVDVDEGDRIKDLRDGAIYAVDEFTRTPRGLSGYSSVTLKLRRTAP